MAIAVETNRRRNDRVFCGLPMEFNGYAGNALDVNTHALFLVLPMSYPVEVGQKGVLKFLLEGVAVSEKVSVARVTKTGISLVSLEENSIFPKLIESSRSGIKFIEHTQTETTVHFRGDFGAEFWDDFLRIYQDKPLAWRYLFNFANVTSISASGLAMLLHLEAHNQGERDHIQISHCNKEVFNTLSQLEVSGINITLLTEDADEDESHKFKVSVSQDAEGQVTVTIRIARMFDYNCRNNFAKIYRGRSGKTNYILDFQDTIHIGKAAFGTMLLLNQYNRENQGRDILITHCSPHIRTAFENMKFDNFFKFS
ncbi:MAG: hypothetical protein HQL99_12430 [Magnetococcales bacterium]|nr:hypothetical protein [Magnetococcales bacterium]